MNDELTTLCIIPNNATVQADWSSIGCETVRDRMAQACLMNIYAFECDESSERGWREYNPTDWTAVEDYTTDVGLLYTFDYMKRLLSKLIPQQSGIFVYSGEVTEWFDDDGVRPETYHPGKITKPESVYPFYAASFASDLADLRGFAPHESPSYFTLAWFPDDDPVKDVFLRKWDEWPDDSCLPMLPSCPSPSDRSIELVRVGWDVGVIGIFIGESLDKDLTSLRLRELLGEDAILAGAEQNGNEFWDWLEFYNLDDLVPIDRKLSFQKD